MVWLYPNVKKKLTLCLAVSTQYRRVTNRRTDGRTPCDSIVRAMLNHRRLLHGTKELEPPNICSPGAHVILKLGLIQNKHRNETVWCVHTLPTKCEGCLTMSAYCKNLQRKPPIVGPTSLITLSMPLAPNRFLLSIN